MKLTVITPTVLRPTLGRTCWSVESQSHFDWQHIVMVDVPGASIPQFMRHPKREWVICGKAHGDTGNHCRHNAYPLIKGTHVVYLDDDDFFLDGAFAALDRALSGRDIDWAVFPAIRMGHRFFNLPPGHCHTMNCQFLHRPIIKGQEIRYPDGPDYCADGCLVEHLKTLADPAIIDGPELVEVNQISRGVR